MSTSAVIERLGARLEHSSGALILSGPESGLLEQQALRLAAGLLCPGNDPRLACDCCRRVFAGLHPDLFRLEPEGVQIRIDRVREALVFGAGRPYEAARRVAVVFGADLLGVEAGNALLKSLEEPGRSFRWILTTTRSASLLPTILSRCALISLAPPSVVDRRAAWHERGFSAEDAEDLSLFEPPPQEAAEALPEFRQARSDLVAALQAGLLGPRVAALLLLAERVARDNTKEARLLAELLADAAISAATPAEVLRHRAVAGITRELGRRLPADALRRAALLAADPPADVRRGNRRLHFERALLQLYLASQDLGRRS